MPQSRLPRDPPPKALGQSFVSLDCRRCGLCAARTQVVPGEGVDRPLAFFVGEAPGPEEDGQGRPFVGRAGKILRRALDAAGWTPGEWWITNVVKCFPHDAIDVKQRIRAPTREEVDACAPHLEAEVRSLRPRLVVALGKTAAQALLGATSLRLADWRGRVHRARAGLDAGVFVTYHPSGLHYGHATVEEFTEDLRAVRRVALETPP